MEKQINENQPRWNQRRGKPKKNIKMNGSESPTELSGLKDAHLILAIEGPNNKYQPVRRAQTLELGNSQTQFGQKPTFDLFHLKPLLEEVITKTMEKRWFGYIRLGQ